MRFLRYLALAAVLGGGALPAATPLTPPVQARVAHTFLALGSETAVIASDGKTLWTYPASTRDGWALPNGNFLLALSKSDAHPGGAAIEVTHDGKTVWKYEGAQSEVNTVQAVGDGRYMLTEAGEHPRVLEIDQAGKVLLEIPLQAQTGDFHLQTRMTRKLKNGNYLSPQLLDKVVREHAPDGKVVWEAHTPDEPKEAWPFTAIRLKNGNTLTTCTHANIVVEFDPAGKIVWQLSNNDLPSPLLKDPCGAQRLANGNTVIASYGQSTPGGVKLLEVTPKKEVVWTYRDDKRHGIHEVQILDDQARPLADAMR